MIHWTDEELAQMKEWDKLVMREKALTPRKKKTAEEKRLREKQYRRTYYLANKKHIQEKNKKYREEHSHKNKEENA
jgi:hypothetical protein